MGLLVDGVWKDAWYDTKESRGRFVRGEAKFRHRVTADGSSGFPAEAGRYHLYVSLACPWASRTLVFRKLKKLEHAISLSIVDPWMRENGWEFSDGPGCIPDMVNGARYLYEVYLAAEPRYTGRVTVPVLWDKQKRTIVNNESADIIRMLNRELDAIGDASLDFYPEALRAEIDRTNELVYENVNNGVYRAGFATSQEAYEEAFDALFAALDQLEERLSAERWLCGESPDGSGLAAVHHARSLRRRLSRALQVQPTPARRVLGAAGLPAGPLPGTGCGRDRRLRPHQDALLPEPHDHQSDRHRAERPGARSRGASRPEALSPGLVR